MAFGDHIKVLRRRGRLRYYHHGVDVGGGYVISKGPDGIVLETLDEFAGGVQPVTVRYWPGKKLPRELCAQNAHLLYQNPPMVGAYSLWASNCEHFATFCCSFECRSEQVLLAAKKMTQLVCAFFVVIAASAVATLRMPCS